MVWGGRGYMQDGTHKGGEMVVVAASGERVRAGPQGHLGTP